MFLGGASGSLGHKMTKNQPDSGVDDKDCKVDEAGSWFWGIFGKVAGHIGGGKTLATSAPDQKKLLDKAGISETLIENLGAGVVVCDATGQLVSFNRVAGEWHGIDPLSIPQSQWASHYDLIDPKTGNLMAMEKIPLVRAFRGEEVHNSELIIVPKGQPRRHLLCQGNRIYGPQGEFLGAVVVMDDVTELKHIEEKLEEARDSAEKANRAKSGFLAAMSHEIRTPLNGILGFASLLRETPLNSEQEDFCESIHRSGEELLLLINDILDFSKIEAGRLELENVSFNLPTLLHELIHFFGPMAKQKGLNIVGSLSPNLPENIMGDPTRLRQILTNVLANAVKFTEKGSIRLEAEASCQNGENPLVRLSVTDSGIGIRPEVLSRIFDAFEQADASVNRRFGGTGLGLTVCRRLAEAMGAYLTVESCVGRGSTFSLQLPVVTATNLPDAPANPNFHPEQLSQTRPLKVLVADDHELNLHLTRYSLRKLGQEVRVVSNGAEALAALQKETFDLVLLDLEMPVLDGIETTRCIRSELPLANQPYIAALTAHTSPGHQKSVLEAGMDEYLKKPTRMQDFADLIERARNNVQKGCLGQA